MNFKSTFVLFLILTVLSACSFKKDGSNDSAPTSAEDVAKEIEKKNKERLQDEVLTESDFSFLVLEGDQPNEYYLQVDYPRKVGVKVFLALNGAQVNQAVFPGAKMNVTGGQHLSVAINVYNGNGDYILNLTKNITIPLDFVVSGTYSLEKDMTANLGRLYFEKRSTLKTNGYLLSIDAKYIIAGAESKIINFNPNEAYVGSQKKSDGGTITLRAQKASGFLIVGLQGATGQNGKSGLEKEKIHGRRDFFRNELAGLDGEDADWEYLDNCQERSQEHQSCGIIAERCISAPTNGGDGEMGEVGYAGDNGQDGGDSGNLFVQIEDYENFTLKLLMRTGQPGKGGRGGPGYQGGDAGTAGKRDPNGACPVAKDGRPGPNGPQGPDGKDGVYGKLGTVELNGLKNVLIEKQEQTPSQP